MIRIVLPALGFFLVLCGGERAFACELTDVVYTFLQAVRTTEGAATIQRACNTMPICGDASIEGRRQLKINALRQLVGSADRVLDCESKTDHEVGAVVVSCSSEKVMIWDFEFKNPDKCIYMLNIMYNKLKTIGLKVEMQ